ncbi:MAG: hypothetical protein GXN92_03565 [Candidatus Micrarchaeota archaeon]|nr:hypothetical protein [Candidatus Micrarchaeota archaeon]
MERKLRRLFSRAYEDIEINIPRVEQREFGIGNLEKKIYKRHLAFLSLEELKAFLIREAPFYISYSAAYYQNPSAPMEKKGFLGADLVFDIDVSLEELEKAKEDVLYLYDVLKQDFGFKDIVINYSGNRGFHIHVRDPEALGIGKEGREALVEYFNLQKFDYKELLKHYTAYRGKKDAEILATGGILGPSPREHKAGFLGKFLTNLYGVLDEKGRKFLLKGDWRYVKSSHVKKALEKTRLRLDVDNQVTSDLSKLIRMENSIHGSTGLQAKVLSLEKLEGFDPWEEAVVFSKEKKVLVQMKESFRIPRKNISLQEGKLYRMPEYLALFVVLQKKAILKD